MRTIYQEIPQEQKDILDTALQSMQKILSLTKEKDNYLDFDIMTLRALLKYKISVEVTQEELDKFTTTNQIDFPEYFWHK